MLQCVRIVRTPRCASQSAPSSPIASDAASSAAWIFCASPRAALASVEGPAPRHAARTRSTAQARLTAVGRDAISTSHASSSAPSDGRAESSSATPYAAAIPMFGAPRTASRPIASATSAAPAGVNHTSLPGSSV